MTNKTARDWLNKWREAGLVEPDRPEADRVRTYRFTEDFRTWFREAGVFG